MGEHQLMGRYERFAKSKHNDSVFRSQRAICSGKLVIRLITQIRVNSTRNYLQVLDACCKLMANTVEIVSFLRTSGLWKEIFV